jgi:hypothetical protein
MASWLHFFIDVYTLELRPAISAGFKLGDHRMNESYEAYSRRVLSKHPEAWDDICATLYEKVPHAVLDIARRILDLSRFNKLVALLDWPERHSFELTRYCLTAWYESLEDEERNDFAEYYSLVQSNLQSAIRWHGHL